jgi:hypothetical protein
VGDCVFGGVSVWALSWAGVRAVARGKEGEDGE